MPSDTRIATSYVANQSFDHNYMNAYVTVLSSSTYRLQPGTILSFGLHQRPVNGDTDMFYRQYFRERWVGRIRDDQQRQLQP